VRRGVERSGSLRDAATQAELLLWAGYKKDFC
jgi:hypothetical protein